MLSNITFINFIDTTLDEKKMILSWRNSPFINKWMHTTQEITLKNHLQFISSLKDKKDKIYFLLKQDNIYIGVIDFTNIDNYNKMAEFGLYANINLHGVGKILLDSICEYGFQTLKLNKLIAEVYIDNVKAINLYEKFNFKKTIQKKKDNRDLICMELKSHEYH